MALLGRDPKNETKKLGKMAKKMKTKIFFKNDKMSPKWASLVDFVLLHYPKGFRVF